MTLTRSRLEQSHRHVAESAGMLSLALSRKKASRMELQEVIIRLTNAKQLVESILNAQD